MLYIRSLRITAAALAGASMLAVPTAASAAACQAVGGAGCLLPLGSRAPVASPISAPPAAAPISAAPVVAEEARGGFGLLAILGVLAAAGAILAIVLLSDDDDEPVSP